MGLFGPDGRHLTRNSIPPKASLLQPSKKGVSPGPASPSPPLPAQTGPQRPQVTERELTPRQRLMPFKQTLSEKDRESQYLSEQAKQAGRPRNVREGGRPKPREHYFNRQIFGNRRCPGCGGRGQFHPALFLPRDGWDQAKQPAGEGRLGGEGRLSQSWQKSWPTSSPDLKLRFSAGEGFDPVQTGTPHTHTSMLHIHSADLQQPS